MVTSAAATDMPCRRCGEITDNLTGLWRPDRTGRLAPYSAQCREPCAPAAHREDQAPRPARPATIRPVTAIKLGRCAVGCGVDVIPGHFIAWCGDGHYHLECVPAETSRTRRRGT